MAACSNIFLLDFGRALQRFEMERETGIEPATNSLEGCDSTTELLPLKAVLSDQLSVISFPADGSQIAFSVDASTDHCSLTTVFLELMTRIELVTSPLPRECSTN